MQEVEEFRALPDDLLGSAKRWQEWLELQRPEEEPMPGTSTSLSSGIVSLEEIAVFAS